MPLKAVVFGATGMVGEGVLLVALRRPDVEAVLVVGRRPCGVSHPKLSELVLPDLFAIGSAADQLRGYNTCFFCSGISSLGKSEQNYTRVTYDLTMAVANTLSRLNPDMTFCYVSGQGTDGTERGRLMWARVKGRTENHLRALPFKAAYAFRPGFIRPVAGQKNAYRVSTFLSPAYPVLHALLPGSMCTLEDLGLAMVAVANGAQANPVLENRDIAALGKGLASQAGH